MSVADRERRQANIGKMERTMIESVQVVSVPVSDQDRARAFYTDTLGFELKTENTFGEGMRWIEVAPKGSTTSLSLVTWFEAMEPGSLQGLVFAVDDVRASYEKLRTKGVSFDFPLREMPGGLQAVFRDPDGNGFVIAGR
jgi:catechol 2,3-dioxygenase-like lactoylglutathione lyase family enzyme